MSSSTDLAASAPRRTFSKAVPEAASNSSASNSSSSSTGATPAYFTTASPALIAAAEKAVKDAQAAFDAAQTALTAAEGPAKKAAGALRTSASKELSEAKSILAALTNNPTERFADFQTKGGNLCVYMTGSIGSGKYTLATGLAKILASMGIPALVFTSFDDGKDVKLRIQDAMKAAGKPTVIIAVSESNDSTKMFPNGIVADVIVQLAPVGYTGDEKDLASTILTRCEGATTGPTMKKIASISDKTASTGMTLEKIVSKQVRESLRRPDAAPGVIEIDCLQKAEGVLNTLLDALCISH